jgi:hypothetical protein
MNLEHMVEFAKEYGPMAMTVLGAVASAIFSGLMWIAKWAWDKHQAEMASVTQAMNRLEKNIVDNRTLATADHIKIKEVLQMFRAEMHLLKVGVDPLKAGILTLEGQVRNQNETINRYVEKMGVVSGKLDAVFRFIDAQPRQTDSLNKQA